ncbi:MAG: hypothetical protein HYV16_00440 [Gammaproteobacteria bacterium]|nr:hypothetical protein [Gammaproteobacteria bacterium]
MKARLNEWLWVMVGVGLFLSFAGFGEQGVPLFLWGLVALVVLNPIKTFLLFLVGDWLVDDD